MEIEREKKIAELSEPSDGINMEILKEALKQSTQS
jgi:hypothetical protein